MSVLLLSSLSLSWCLDAAAARGSGEEATRLPGPFWVTWRWLLYSLACHTFPALEQERKLTPGSLGSTGGKYIPNRLRSLPPEDPIFLKPQSLKDSFILCKVPRGGDYRQKDSPTGLLHLEYNTYIKCYVVIEKNRVMFVMYYVCNDANDM